MARHSAHTGIAVGAMLLLVAAACAPAAAPTATRAPAPQPTATSAPSPATPTARAQTAPRGEATYLIFTDLVMPDPHKMHQGSDSWFAYSVFGNLLTRDATGQIVPEKATSWKFSEDKLNVEVVLRKDVKWHNGDPFTAQDLKFSFDRMKSPEGQGGSASARLLQSVKDVEVVDPYKVVYRLQKPEAIFDKLILEYSIWPVPKGYVEKVGDKKFLEQPIGAGPWKFVERKVGERVVLESNADYFGEFSDVKRLVVRSVPEVESRVAALLTGEADLVEGIAPHLVDRVKGAAPKARIIEHPANMSFPLWFTTYHATDPRDGSPNPFLDKKVRQAFIYAVDRKAIVQNILAGRAIELVSAWGPGVDGYDSTLQPYPYDPQKAKQMLEEAKFPFDKEFEVVAYRASPMAVQAVEAAAGYLSKIGLKTKFKVYEIGDWVLASKEGKHYGITLARATDLTYDPVFIVSIHGALRGLYKIADNKELETMTDQASGVFPPERSEFLKKLYRAIYDQAYAVPLYNEIQFFGISERLDWATVKGTATPRGLERLRWRSGFPR